MHLAYGFIVILISIRTCCKAGARAIDRLKSFRVIYDRLEVSPYFGVGFLIKLLHILFARDALIDYIYAISELLREICGISVRVAVFFFEGVGLRIDRAEEFYPLAVLHRHGVGQIAVFIARKRETHYIIAVIPGVAFIL